MRRQLPGRHDVLDRPIAHQQIVRDDSPVASPPQSFGAHVRGARAGRRVSQFAQTVGEIPTLRVVCVRSESRQLPCRMLGVGALRAAPAAEVLEPSILDPRALERPGQFRLVELRPSLRAGVRSHVGHQGNAMLAEQFEEPLDRMRRVSDREDQRRLIARWGRRPLSPTARF
jgi:hypothetical protein